MTHHMDQMLQAHPMTATISRDALTQAIGPLTSYAAICIVCADASLAEEQVVELRKCIRQTPAMRARFDRMNAHTA